MKRIINFLLFAAMVALAYQAYGRYQDRQEVGLVSEKMRGASNRVITLASFFKQPGGETYREVLAYGDESIKEMGAAVLAIQSIKGARNPKTTEHAIQYLKASQTAVRAVQEVVRAKMAVEMRGDEAGKLANTLKRYVTNPGSDRNKVQADIAMYQVDDAMDEVKSAETRYEAATAELQERLIELVSMTPPSGSGLPGDVYVPAEKVDGMRFTVRLKPLH